MKISGYCGNLIFLIAEPHPTGVLYNSDYNWICDKLRPHAHKWKDIAHGLGFLAAELNCIEADPKNLINAPASYLYAMLDSWLQWAPGDDRGSRDYATVRSLSTAVDKAGLGVLAQDLMVLCEQQKQQRMQRPSQHSPNPYNTLV